MSTLTAVGIVVAGLATEVSATTTDEGAATAAACSYQATQIASVPGYVSDTDGAERFVGLVFPGTPSDPYPHGVVWSDASIAMDFGPLNLAFGVNRSGDAVGAADGGTAAVLVPYGGTAIRLARPVQATVSIPTPAGISDDGLIIGNVRFDDGTYHGLAWSLPTAATVVRDLGAVGITNPVRDVSDTGGQIVGAMRSGNVLRASSGTVDGMRPLGGVDSTVDSEANDIAGRFILGTGAVPAQGRGNVLWDNGVATLLPGTGTATDVNSTGLVVGYQTLAGQDQAFVINHGVRTVLPALAGHFHARALAVTEDGRIAGWSRSATTRSVPIVWSCSFS